ncbi:MAG: hypothetical protein NZ958_04960 [Bacteroidia bacterium]|nr:hypothetical protein [Bacteroidia bacterium]MDW8088891.1 hypothetical protein [Bacteroidia bacterium]
MSLLWGQLTFNPYSGYGIGLPHLGAATAGMGMGRLSCIGAETPLPEQPAHSAHLRSVQADFSGYGRRIRLQTPTQIAHFGTGGLQNLLLSFSRGRGWGFAMGLLPQYLQGYISAPQSLGNGAFFSERAEGMLTLAYLQLALRWRHLALGYQFGYLWGTYERRRTLQPPIQPLPDYLITQTYLGGPQHRFGLLWQDSLGPWALQISLTYTPSTTLSQENLYTFQKNFNYTAILLDTFAFTTGRWGLGSSLRGGMGIGHRKWWLGLEGSYHTAPQKWEAQGVVPRPAKPSWDVRAGLVFVPERRSPKFYQRLHYQFGALAAQPPYTEIRWYGLTFGLGWQFPKLPNLVFLSLEYGWLPDSYVHETYLQVGIGMLFRELWFIPPRID